MTKAIKMNWERLVREADGFEGVEYAAMTALLLTAIIAALITLGLAVMGQFAVVTQVVQI
jgi:Flp pilus assembly pilin Flp